MSLELDLELPSPVYLLVVHRHQLVGQVGGPGEEGLGEGPASHDFRYGAHVHLRGPVDLLEDVQLPTKTTYVVAVHRYFVQGLGYPGLSVLDEFKPVVDVTGELGL